MARKTRYGYYDFGKERVACLASSKQAVESLVTSRCEEYKQRGAEKDFKDYLKDFQFVRLTITPMEG